MPRLLIPIKARQRLGKAWFMAAEVLMREPADADAAGHALLTGLAALGAGLGRAACGERKRVL